MSLPEKLNKAQRERVDLFTSLGVEITPELEKDILSLSPRTQEKSVPQSIMPRIVREAEAVLTSLFSPKTVITRECLSCKEKFQTNYMSEHYCSNECRVAAMAEIGIAWDPNKPEAERYEFKEPPSTIGKLTYHKLRQWAQTILDLPVDRYNEHGDLLVFRAGDWSWMKDSEPLTEEQQTLVQEARTAICEETQNLKHDLANDLHVQLYGTSPSEEVQSHSRVQDIASELDRLFDTLE